LDVHVEASAQVESLMVGEESASISLKNGAVLNAKLVIGADGGNSWVRRQSGVSVKIHEYQEMGVVANFETELPHGNIARQWFTENGVLAWLPLPENRISIVWSTDNAAELMKLSPEELANKVSEAGGHALGILRIISKTAAFKLVKQTANRLISPRVVLVGDAAHQIHALAGQGVNLGFRDVIALSETLKQSRQYEDIGDSYLLRRYERARQADILALGSVTHGLHGLFEHQSPMVKKIRNLGLGLTGQQQVLKNYLIRQAIA
jgi:2-polyprenylphenol 6-hydroxylase